MDATAAFIDANVFACARLDGGEAGDRARERLATVAAGRLKAATSPLVLDEVLWVVWRQTDRATAVATVRTLGEELALRMLALPGNLMELALLLIENHGLKPRDALHAATMQHHRLAHIISDDSDFDRLEWMVREGA